MRLDMAVAVVLWCGGNQEAEMTPAAVVVTGPAAVIRIWPTCTNLETAKS